jgi:hypothetical protein
MVKHYEKVRQLPSSLPPPPEHSRFRCCRGARPLPRGASPAVAVTVAVVVCACRQRGASPAVAVIVRTRCQGVALRRERVRKCSRKEHRWSQAKEPVV